MSALSASLSRVLGDTFVMYVHTHGFHWNIVDPGFPQYHSFLDSLYNELWSAVDDIAEHVRAVGAFAPSSMVSLLAASTIPDTDIMTAQWPAIRVQLLMENGMVISSLQSAFEDAQAVNDQGTMNFLADRLDKHAKHAWMLNSSR